MKETNEIGVTAIVPHWGEPGTLERALRSIYSQTAPVAETIVVDDASPAEHRANVRECIEKMRGEGMPVRMFELAQNSGPSSARNFGWNKARTEYVAFLDSDDVWHPEKISKQIALMRETGAVFCGHIYCPDRPMEVIDNEFRTYGFGDFLVRNRVSTPTVVLRRDLQERFPEHQRRSEDYALWLRLAKKQPMVFLSSELARGFKNPWGESGLSGDLTAMTLGQVQTYRGLWREGLVGFWLVKVLIIWSWLRHARRVLIRRWKRHSEPVK